MDRHELAIRRSCGFLGVESLAVSGDSLYVGGAFQKTIAGTNINHIARYNGTNWSSLGAGVSGMLPSSAPSVNAIDVHGTEVFVGGAFTSAGGQRNIYNFARWDGATWNSFGPLLRFVDGKFQVTLGDALGRTYGIEVSDDLIHWARVATYSNLDTASQFIDENSVGAQRRFYRAVTP